MIKRVTEVKYEMKCSICGKEETIVEEDCCMIWEWWTRCWSRIEWSQYRSDLDDKCKTLDLCPTCTRKFKKLVKMVDVNEEE